MLTIYTCTIHEYAQLVVASERKENVFFCITRQTSSTRTFEVKRWFAATMGNMTWHIIDAILHISGNFLYLDMIWSCCDPISKSLLYIVLEVKKCHPITAIVCNSFKSLAYLTYHSLSSCSKCSLHSVLMSHQKPTVMYICSGLIG